tara:strand:+ start:379 stop:759 length:381 start_codon:yes stop_codon:yes gene_type:complete
MKKSKMTLRFNLGRGINYKKWKITTTNQSKVYLDPNDVILKLENCKLYNSKKQSQKIFEGGNKRVCSWVECDDILSIGKIDETKLGGQVFYNPRKFPNWVDEWGNDLDGLEFQSLVTQENKVYIYE